MNNISDWLLKTFTLLHGEEVEERQKTSLKVDDGYGESFHSCKGKDSDSKSTGCRTIIGKAKKEETLVKKKNGEVSMLVCVYLEAYEYLYTCTYMYVKKTYCGNI